MTTVLSAMGFLVFVYAFMVGLRLYQSDRNRAKPLLASCIIFCVGLCNDALVQMGGYRSIYLVEYIYMAMNEVFTGTQSQNDHIKNSHQTINDLLTNIHNISREAQQGATITQDTARRIGSSLDVMKQSFDRITNVEQSVTEMTKSIELFSSHSRKIDSMVDFINEIAQRINVLSLNVAIEATKSGAANSGLMIVSKEIRQLSKNAKDHTKEITDVITDFQGDIEKVRKAMLEGSGHVKQLGHITGLGKSGLDEILKLIEDEEARLQRISSKRKWARWRTSAKAT